MSLVQAQVGPQKNKLMYRIQQRLYTSNIIEKNIGTSENPKWIPFVAPLCKKEQGDSLCEFIFNSILK